MTLTHSKTAEAKARALLESLLTDEQKVDFLNGELIKEKGGTTGHTYYIALGYSQNIQVDLPTAAIMNPRQGNCECPECKQPRRRVVCCYMRADVPYWDQMAAQLLFIRHAEEHFLSVAYVS